MNISKPSALSLIFTASFMFFSAPALARSYLVELVVFKNLQQSGNETWNANYPALNARKLSRSIIPADIMKGFETTPVEVENSDFFRYVKKIERNPRRRVILSTHWIQAVGSPATTTIARMTNRVMMDSNQQDDRKPETISGDELGGTTPELLDGFINFYLAGQYTIEADIRYSPAYRPSILDDETVTGPETYRIYEKRKMKSGEINYYDHPKIGMLLRVSPVVDEALKTQPIQQ